jgi:hypothetical protein
MRKNWNRLQTLQAGRRIKQDLENYYWNLRILLKGEEKEYIDATSDIGELFYLHLKVLDSIDYFEMKEVQDYIKLQIGERRNRRFSKS